MLRTVSVATLVAVSGLPLMAQEITYGAASIDYTQFTNDPFGDDPAITTLDGDVELTFGNILVSLDAASSTFSIDEDSFSFRSVTVGAGYMITPEILVGAGFSASDFDDVEQANGYEIYAQYVTDGFGGAVRYIAPNDEYSDFYFTQFFAEASLAPGATVSAVIESYGDSGERDYHIAADYDAGTYFGRGYYASYSEADFGFVGVNAGYRFGMGLTGSAGFQTIMGDTDFDYRAYSVTGSYELTQDLSVDLSVSVFGGDSFLEDITEYGFGLTYEMGGQKRLDNRLFAAARKDLSGGELSFNPFSDYGLVGFGF